MFALFHWAAYEQDGSVVEVEIAYSWHSVFDVAVNVPVSAVALRVPVVVKLFQRNGILFRPHLPRPVFLDFFVGEVILFALASVWDRSP